MPTPKIKNMNILEQKMHPLMFLGVPDKDKKKYVLNLDINLYSRNNSIVSTIKEIVCREFNIEVAQMMTKTRVSIVAVPRMLCMALMRENTTMTLKKIGAEFYKDHSMVIYACEVTEILKKQDKFFNAKYIKINSIIQELY